MTSLILVCNCLHVCGHENKRGKEKVKAYVTASKVVKINANFNCVVIPKRSHADTYQEPPLAQRTVL